MFEDRSYKRTFYSAPQSVTSLVAAFMEPTITVAVYLAVAEWFDEPVLRPDLTLCLLIFALTFPGRNRFEDRPLNAAVDIGTSWLSLLLILALCGYATRSLGFFDPTVLAWWAATTPVLQWLAFFAGRGWLRHRATLPAHRRSAIVVGASALGVKVSRAFQARGDSGLSFLGYFDDRTDDRVDPAASGQRLGTLREAAPYVRAHGVNEVYITLPLGSQPRIVELLEQVQGTTASIFYVPDVFGISIIQGRLKDMNGVPVVGICETPFTGTNELVKRISDIVLASAHPGADRAAAAGAGHRREAQFARAGDLPPAPQRPGRRRDRGLEVPLDAHAGQRHAWCSRRPRTTRASRPSAPSSAAPRWTSCRSSSTCCRAA